MTRIPGPSLDQLDRLGDDYAGLAARSLAHAARQMQVGTGVEDVGVLRDWWRQNVEDDLLPALGVAFEVGAATIRVGLREATGLTAAAVTVAPTSDALAEAYLAQVRNRLVGVGDELWATARGQLLEGLQAGESVPELAARVRQAAPDLAEPRAAQIARTEVLGAVNAGALEQVLASGATGSKEWVAAHDARVRPEHEHADNQTVGLREKFTVGGFPADRPHDPALPPHLSVNCFPGEAVAESLAAVRRVYRRWYEGVMVRVDTASGVQVTGTPNHPVLTDAGWKPLESLDVGDQLVQATVAERVGGGEPQIGDVPAPLAEFYRAATEARQSDRVAGRGVDFHGDGTSGEVEVVTLDGNLPLPAGESLGDSQLLGSGDAKGSLLGRRVVPGALGEDKRRERREAVVLPVGRVSSGGEPFSSLEVGRGHTGEHGVAAASDRDASLDQPESDGIPRDPIPLGEHFLRGPSDIGGSDSGSVQEPPALSVGRASGGDAHLSQPRPDDGRRAADFLADFLQREALTVQLDKVVNVERLPWGGHVFNLETESGWYICNSIISSNCRCAISFELDLDSRPVEPEPAGPTERTGPTQGSDRSFLARVFGDGLAALVGWFKARTAAAMIPSGEQSFEPEGGAVTVEHFRSRMITEGLSTGLRTFAPGSLVWRDPPFALRWQKIEPESGGHGNAVHVGNVTRAERQGQEIWGYGPLDLDSVDGLEYARKLATGHAPWVSIGLDEQPVDVEVVLPEETGDGLEALMVEPDQLIFHSGRIAELTGVTAPAQAEAFIEPTPALLAELRARGVLEPEEALAAAASLDDYRPPAEWFEAPGLKEPTGIVVGDDGRIYGHAALSTSCHIGFADQCVSPPHEADHPYFLTGEVVTADGSRVPVGQITLATGHAPLSYGAQRAAEHYDDTGSVVADVTCGNDEHGIWVAGAVRPGTDPGRIHELRASGQLSGDWRRIGGQLRLVALLAVNVPGFPVPRPRARVASGSAQALVAAGKVEHGAGQERPDLSKVKQRIAASIKRDPRSRREAVAARVKARG